MRLGFAYQSTGPEAVVAAVHDVLSGRVKVAHLVIADHPANCKTPRLRQVWGFGLGTDPREGTALRWTGEDDDPMGAGSSSIIRFGCEIKADEAAAIIAYNVALASAAWPDAKGWIFRPLDEMTNDMPIRGGFEIS